MTISHITLSQDDINNPLHPNLWQSICDDLGVTLEPRPGTSDSPVYPEAVTLTVTHVESE